LNSTQVNIEAVQLGDIIEGQEVVTILDRQDDKLIYLYLADDESSISARHGRIITVQR